MLLQYLKCLLTVKHAPFGIEIVVFHARREFDLNKIDPMDLIKFN